MAIISADKMTLEALEAYDQMMLECTMKVEKLAGLATAIWGEVLQELDNRGKVRLVSGSYSDVGNALIQRLG